MMEVWKAANPASRFFFSSSSPKSTHSSSSGAVRERTKDEKQKNEEGRTEKRVNAGQATQDLISRFEPVPVVKATS